MSQLVVGNYTLGELLGRGGMSDVYAARHDLRGDAVAVKLLRGDGDAAEAAMADALVAEAMGTREIRHPNVVRVLEVGRDARTGRCYLVMERVEGENLAARLRRVGRLDEDAVRALGAAIADGMEAVHARGIVHRDLKPANVMLCGDAPKIVDFGIAKHLGAQSAVTTARRIGTPAYMAPEQFCGGLIAPAVDLWALGVILFEAATGRLPFEGFDDGRCPQLFEAPRRAAELAPVSSSLEALLARCLAREPGRRPRSMAEVARALRSDGDERVTQGLGALVPMPASTPAGAAARAGRTRWPFVAIGAGVVVALVAGAIARGGSSSSPTAAPTAGSLPAAAPTVGSSPSPTAPTAGSPTAGSSAGVTAAPPPAVTAAPPAADAAAPPPAVTAAPPAAAADDTASRPAVTPAERRPPAPGRRKPRRNPRTPSGETLD